MTTAISSIKEHQEALEKELDVAHRPLGVYMGKDDDKDDFLICSFTKDEKVIIPSEGTNK